MGIFRNADVNKDGIVSGSEAIEFFNSTGIDKKHLKDIWDIATESQPGGLTPAQFSRALRLVSLLQTGCVFTDEFISKALHPQTGLQLPDPKIGAHYLRRSANHTEPASVPSKPSQQISVDKSSASSKDSPARDRGVALASPPVSEQTSSRKQQLKSSTDFLAPPDAPEGSEAPSKGSCNDYSLVIAPNSKHAPVATLKVVVRAQANLEDIVAPFRLLCSGQGLLIAAPTQSGGFALWANANTEIKTLSAQNCPPMRNGEDIAAGIEAKEIGLQALGSALPPPLGFTVGAVHALHFCDFSELLLCGHKDGKVSFWKLPGPDGVPQPRLVFLAHRNSGVAALATTPWGGLWTGGERGSVRLWPKVVSEALASQSLAEGLVMPMGKELRGAGGGRAHFKCIGIRLAASGQMVVTVGRDRAALWDSQSGTNLGNVYTSGASNTNVDAHRIDAEVGIAVDTATKRAIVGVLGAQVPPLGADLADTEGADQNAVAVTINKMSSTAAAVTTAAAKKCVLCFADGQKC